VKTIMGDYITRHEGAPSLEAIAWGLARIPRFAGHTVGPWSVAHHSLVIEGLARHVAEEAGLSIYNETALRLAALIHDAHEAVTSDVPTEFKTPAFKGMQKALDARINASLRLPDLSLWHQTVAALDTRALLAEAYLMTPSGTYRKITLDHPLWLRTVPSDAVVVEVVRDLFPTYEPDPIQQYLLSMLKRTIITVQGDA
jgi:hypothetical protein